MVDIQNFNVNSSCTSVVLLDASGNDVIEITVTRIPNIGIARYMGDFVPFNKVIFNSNKKVIHLRMFSWRVPQ